MRDRLLAKSARDRRERTLHQHTKDVIDAAHALFGTVALPTRLGRCWLRFFKIESAHWKEVSANLIAACALHDWGKANEGMQSVLVGRNEKQLFRHEHVSVRLRRVE